MRYFLLLLILSVLISSCKKNSSYNYNPCRSEILGNYHFLIFYSPFDSINDTIRYNGNISIPVPDNGNEVNVNYPNATTQNEFTTTDSSLASLAWGCPHYGSPLIGGNFRHDTIFLTDQSNVCDGQANGYYVFTIGVKY